MILHENSLIRPLTEMERDLIQKECLEGKGPDLDIPVVMERGNHILVLLPDIFGDNKAEHTVIFRAEGKRIGTGIDAAFLVKALGTISSRQEALREAFKEEVKKHSRPMLRSGVKITSTALDKLHIEPSGHFNMVIGLTTRHLNQSGRREVRRWTLGEKHDDTADLRSLMKQQAGALASKKEGFMMDRPTRMALLGMNAKDREKLFRLLRKKPTHSWNRSWTRENIRQHVSLPSPMESVKVQGGRIFVKVVLGERLTWVGDTLKLSQCDIPHALITALRGRKLAEACNHSSLEKDAVITSASIDWLDTMNVKVRSSLTDINGNPPADRSLYP